MNMYRITSHGADGNFFPTFKFTGPDGATFDPEDPEFLIIQDEDGNVVKLNSFQAMVIGKCIDVGVTGFLAHMTSDVLREAIDSAAEVILHESATALGTDVDA